MKKRRRKNINDTTIDTVMDAIITVTIFAVFAHFFLM